MYSGAGYAQAKIVLMGDAGWWLVWDSVSSKLVFVIREARRRYTR
jgi:hypothetical protein